MLYGLIDMGIKSWLEREKSWREGPIGLSQQVEERNLDDGEEEIQVLHITYDFPPSSVSPCAVLILAHDSLNYRIL